MVKTENYLRIGTTIFFANKKLIISSTVIVGILAVLVVLFFPPVYDITGSVLIKSKKLPTAPESVADQTYSRNMLPVGRQDVASEVEILTSYDLIKMSLEKLCANNDACFSEPGFISNFIKNYVMWPVQQLGNLFSTGDGSQQVSKVDKLARDVKSDLTVQAVPGSNVITVELMYGDAVMGSKIVNAILDNYLLFRSNASAGEKSVNLYADQITKYDNEIAGLEKRKLDILRKVGTTNVVDESTLQREQVNQLSDDLRQLEDQFLEKERTVRYLRTLFNDYKKKESAKGWQPFPYDFDDAEIARFNERLTALSFDYADSLRTYEPGSQKALLYVAQIEDMQKQLNNLIEGKIIREESELATLKDRAAAKSQKLEDLRKWNKDLAEAQIELARIENRLELGRANYDAFYKKAEENKIELTSDAAKLTDVQLISRASVPDKPFFPIAILVIPIGILAGFILGFSMAYVKEFFDHSFKMPSEVERYLNLSVIGSIPYHDRGTENHHKKGFPGDRHGGGDGPNEGLIMNLADRVGSSGQQRKDS